MCIATTFATSHSSFFNPNFASSPLVESIYLLPIDYILIQQLRLYHPISRCHLISICYSLVHTLFVTTPPPASSIIQLSTQLCNVFLVGWISNCHYWSWKDIVVMERVRHTIIPCCMNSNVDRSNGACASRKCVPGTEINTSTCLSIWDRSEGHKHNT